MVMGLGTDTLAWIPQMPAFSERYRTIVFDNRDVGRSDYSDGPYEVADMAADALALCDELELDSFNLLGVSMGGTIAQEMALAGPERVRTLTLCVTWAGTGRYGAERGRILAASAQQMPVEEHLEMLLLLTMSEAFYENAEAVDYLRGMMLKNPNLQEPEAFARQAQASGRHDARDRVSALSMPVHVIGAEHDVLVPVWKSRELAALIPGAKLTVIDGAPHGVNLERAEEFNRAVLDFLASAADRATGAAGQPRASARERTTAS
ncbi:MAG: alpha/beta fold hydrolase [Thermoleophilaceae bacterium]|jgi:pimeloyl-ACP methyl ester carboxylesterase|nr:alpha/beta fold hydrolase [Thermoleophilaceae bacterium]